MANKLYYGDNLEILRTKVRDESVDLCYIDPPFNSNRTYNQIYTNVGQEDLAQAQAFVDTWVWDDKAKEGYSQIISNHEGRFAAQTIDLITGLRNVLKEGSLLAYLVSMTLRIVEIQRVLKPTDSFYLHCDPKSSHYLKLVLDGVFCSQGGDFQNEVVWSYQTGGASKQRFARKHDVIFYYTKSDAFTFNADAIREPRTEKSLKRAQNPKGARISADNIDKLPTDVFQIPALNPMAVERLGYPTQKPEALLERIIRASSNEGDAVLGCYCGCGTTIAVAQKLKRKWIGMDITYQSISLVLKRLERDFGPAVAQGVVLDGVPRDMESAAALAHKKDDRSRKEFEKWVILAYTNNRGVINEKKGGDRGIDGIAYILTSDSKAEKMLLQVKSGGTGRADIAKLRGDMEREGARMGTLITLEEPTKGMVTETKTAGMFNHPLTGTNVDKIRIVTVKQIVEDKLRLDLPVSLDALWKATQYAKGAQLPLFVPATAQPRKPAASVPAQKAKSTAARSS